MVGIKIGIDFGSANVTVVVEGRGVVICEPSVMVCDASSGKVLAMGHAAREMLGKLPPSLVPVFPIKDGLVNDFEAARMMLSRYIEKIAGGKLFRPNVLLCVPSTVNEIALKSLFNVVMAAGASGILLHEAMGHAFEADFNRKGQSIFSDRMGSRICAKGIQIVDDGTLPGNRGAVGWDDEGVPGQKTYMVEDGILTSYLHDRISAAWYGVAPTGNGRRESFRYAPIPRMRATYMEAGGEDPRAIVERVKEGIFVDQFSNGQVKIGEGDFTFFVKSGWLIENGRLTMPVKDINIIGNGPQALSDIVAVGSDLKIDEGAWTCGKEQSCPVSCGIPTVLVSRLTVGGVEG